MKNLLLIIVLLPFMAFSQLTTIGSYGYIIDVKGDTIETYIDGINKPDRSLDQTNNFLQTNVFKEWRKYIKDCNKVVPDTTTQYGTVNVALIPVRVNGKTVSYVTQPKDTVWTPFECKEYKFSDLDNTRFTSQWIGGIGISTTSALTTVGSKMYLESSEAVQKYSINREVICKIKKRKASFEDFWNRWLVERNLIEFN